MVEMGAIIGAFILSVLLTGGVRHFSLRNKILDIPNERSSHTVPTPRGGGVGFVTVFVGVMSVWVLTGAMSWRLWSLLVAGGVVLAVTGWLDDRYQLSARSRFLVHSAVAGFAVWNLGGLPALQFGPWELYVGAWGLILATVGVVWSINLYNFMDGIDGLAGGQAVVVALAGGGFLAAAGDWELARVSWLLSAAVAGFLAWNWSPARIFMGDVGSGFLGYMFAAFAIGSEQRGSVPLVAWVLMLGVFVVDTTATLIRRWRDGERLATGHRTHAYQLAVQAGLTHGQVAGLVLVLTTFLVGLVAVGLRYPMLFLPIATVVTTILLVVWWRVNRRRFAGSPRDYGSKVHES